MRSIGSATYENNMFVFKTDYNEAYKNEIKKAKARWNPESKTWNLKIQTLTNIEDVERITTKYNITYDITTLKRLYVKLSDDKQKKEELIEMSKKADMKECSNINMPPGITLYPYQQVAVKWIESVTNALIGDEMGCIDGESIVSINRAKNTRKYKLKDVYTRFNNSWNKDIPSKIRSLKDGRFGLNDIKNVLYKGKQNVLHITLESGKNLKLTPDHEVLTPSGWCQIQYLDVNSTIIVNGNNVCSECGCSENIITYEYAKFKGLCKKCMYKKRKNGSKVYETERRFHKHDGYIYLFGEEFENHPRKSARGVLEHIHLMEQKLGRSITIDEEVHHINKIRHDNRLENLIVLSRSEHKKIHKTENHFKDFVHKSGSIIITVPKEEKIISIEKIADAIDVYDIIVEDPYRNFIVNNIVVHNCGKTPEALAYCYNNPEKLPVLIIVPACVKVNWKREIGKFCASESLHIISGRKNTPLPKVDYYIINYDIVKDWVAPLKQLNYQILIVDEIHFLKSPASLRTKACIELAEHKSVKNIIGLTGTPILNRPIELLPILKILNVDHVDLNNDWAFKNKYCFNGRSRYGVDFSGANNLDELQILLRSTCMIRRLKKDVLTELPEKRRTIIPLEISNRKSYDKAETNFRKWYHEEKGKSLHPQAETLVKINELKRIAGKGKLKMMFEYIDDVLSNDEKIIIVAYHRAMQNAIYNHYKNKHNTTQIIGGMTANARVEAEDQFQKGDAQILVLSLMAGGVGINLQSASNMIITELAWTPGVLMQVEDRIHRIGQKNTCNITYLMAENTIEERIMDVLNSKQRVIESSLDGTDDTIDSDVFGEVIDSFI